MRKASTDVILRQAIEDNDIAQARFVLRFESDKVNDQDENDMTALHWSCVYGRLEIIGILLEYGANMEMRDSKGWTALHFAANGGFLDVVEMLLSSYADVTATSKDGKGAIDVARGEGMVFLLATGFIKAGKEELLLRYFSDSTASLHSIDEVEEESLIYSPMQSEIPREIWRASQQRLTKASSMSIESKSSLKASTSEYGIAKDVLTSDKERVEVHRKKSTPCMKPGQSATLSRKQRLNNFDSSFSPGVLRRLAVSESNLNKTQEMDCTNNNNKVAPCGTINRVSNYSALNAVDSDTNMTEDGGRM